MTARANDAAGPRAPVACVVANPSKRALTPAVRERVTHALQRAGYPHPQWLETTPSETGATQARLAVASGARLVLALGGDGTVRAVAAGLAGTGVAMGIIPLGTANLAARNLGLPVRDLGAQLEVATSGTAGPVDLARVSTEPAGTGPTTSTLRTGPWARPTLGAEHTCLVVAGMGFDAALVASTRPALKARLTWGAYALAALGQLRSPRMALSVSVDGAPAHEVTARCLLVASGGRLPAGIVLLREAVMDDGVLDVAAIDTVGGLAGWTDLARQVLPPFAASYSNPERSLGRVRLTRGTQVEVRSAHPFPVQVDGELVAPTRVMRVRLEPGAVLVQRP